MTDGQPESHSASLSGENITFAAGSRRWMILLRGPWRHPLDRFLVRWTGVSLVGLQFALANGRKPVPAMLVTTVGKKSGELWTVVLPYTRDGDGLVVMGSNIGEAKDPHWVTNMRAQPLCWLTLHRRRVPADARVSEGAERERLFELIAVERPQLRQYQQRADHFGRKIPLVVLTPRQSMR